MIISWCGRRRLKADWIRTISSSSAVATSTAKKERNTAIDEIENVVTVWHLNWLVQDCAAVFETHTDWHRIGMSVWRADQMISNRPFHKRTNTIWRNGILYPAAGLSYSCFKLALRCLDKLEAFRVGGMSKLLSLPRLSLWTSAASAAAVAAATSSLIQTVAVGRIIE